MKKKLKYFILSAAFICLGFGVHAQVAQGPPTPKTTQSAAKKGPGPPCDRPDNPGNGNGSPPPPPPGLCLPINDYLVPLFLSGILLGAYKVWKIEKEEETEKL